MNESLYRHLVASGIAEDAAQNLAKGFNPDVDDSADVDVERLQKALDGVAQAMQVEPQPQVDEAIREAQDVAEAVTKGADALLNEVRTQNDALAKGLLAIGEEMRAVRDFLIGQNTAVAQVEQSVEAVKKSLSEPVAAKALGTPARPVASPQDAPSTEGPLDLIKSAMAEIKSENTDKVRAQTLRKAIIQLESGVPVEAVRETLALH